jgi:hypothetical protein
MNHSFFFCIVIALFLTNSGNAQDVNSYNFFNNNNDINRFVNSMLNELPALPQQGNQIFQKHTGDFYRPVNVYAEDTTRYVSVYNQEGQVTFYTTEKLRSQQWVQVERVESFYTNGYLTEVISHNFNNNQWELEFTKNYTYDSNGNILIYFVRIYFDSLSYGEIETSYTYENNRIIEYISRIDSNNNMRGTLEYNSTGLVETSTLYKWENNDWKNYMRWNIGYDGSLIISSTMHEWSTVWDPVSRIVYSYENELIKERLQQNWLNNTWENNSRDLSEYYAGGLIETRITQVYTNQQWQNDYRSYFNYDTSDNLVELYADDWSGTGWINYKKFVYEYDSNNNAVRGDSYKWISGSWIHVADLLEMKYNNGTDVVIRHAKWMTVDYDIFSGTDDYNLISGINYSLESNYPNPFNPSTTIKYSLGKAGRVNITIYNALGEFITELKNEFQTAGNHEVNFTANNLSSGTYFYTLTASSNNGTTAFRKTGKMMMVK